ncbi:MAG: hypothetical protein JNJ57_03115 [Saprospiraceae bacterium]|nr:hypothetical protein [Saprospiraceae bacterium]
MIYLLLFLLIFLSLLVLLLSLPMELEINTSKNVYRMRWRHLVSVWVLLEETGFHVWMQLLFWSKELKTEKHHKTDSDKPLPKHNKRPIRHSFAQIIALTKRLWRAIFWKRFRVNIDTGDFLLNAWLYPVGPVFNKKGRSLRINFNGVREVDILLQTRPVYLLWAFLQSFITTKSTKS